MDINADEKKSDTATELFSYYIDIDWFPIPKVNSERYKINKSQVTCPEIIQVCNTTSGRIYEVSDPYLFYCSTADIYEYYVYTIKGKDDCTIRIVKYKIQNKDVNFKLCIKSTRSTGHYILDYLSPNNIPSANILKYFNPNLYNEIERPVFIEKKYSDGIICDMISENNVILLSLSDFPNFIRIGITNIQFRAKAEVLFLEDKIQISLFDVHNLSGSYLRNTYNERYNIINQLIVSNKYYPFVEVDALKGLNIFSDTDNFNEIIIIDNNNINYMIWKSKPTIISQAQDKRLLLKDGFIEGISNIPALGIIELNIITNSIKQKYDALSLDRYSFYKAMINGVSQSIYSMEVLKRVNKQIINNFSRRNMLKMYATGKTLIIMQDLTLLYSLKMLDVPCDDMQSLPSDEDEVKRILEPYHTIVLDKIYKGIDVVNSSKKIIQLFNTELTVKDAGEKTFIFLLGPMGCGKSSLIKIVRSMFPMSGALLIAQIDKLVESDIEYINSSNEETYLRLRKNIYNNVMDQMINKAISTNNSIILESTRVDPEYVKWLKTYHYKIVIAIVNESFEIITENINIRNKSKIRKTYLSIEKYNEFYNVIPLIASQYGDIIINLNPGDNK